MIVLLGGFGVAIAPAVSAEIDELVRRIPEAVDDFRGRVEEYAWGRRLTDHLTPGGLFSAEGRTAAV